MKRVLLFALGLVIAAIAVIVAVPREMAQSVADTAIRPDTLSTTLLSLAVAGTLASEAVSLDTPGANTDQIRYWLNKLTAWNYYISRNGVISTTVATLPVVAIGGTADLVKTTNATVLKNAGVHNALAATDDFWTPNGAAIANASGAAQFVRYLLCADADDAASVIRSTVAATKALCEFPNLPADGIAIVGILTVEIDDATTFTPGTTLLSAAGITDTYQDGHDDDAVFRLGGKLLTR